MAILRTIALARQNWPGWTREVESVWPEQKMRCRRTLLGALEVESGEVFTYMVSAIPWGRDRSHPRTLGTDTIHECTVR
jgi:hypothetical protein